jgi:acyl-CoA synthetase (AMP-forming)/AMP-acid ligase II
VSIDLPTVSLADLVWTRACAMPASLAFQFLNEVGEEAEARSYADLAQRAHTVAAALRTRAAPGDRAALMFNPGIAFLDAFFGCIYAGVIAVPMMPPRPHRERMATVSILRDCAPRLILTTEDMVEPLRQRLAAAGLHEMPEILAVDEVEMPTAPNIDAAMPPPHQAARDDIAFLQYTSGSTSLPKGVMVSHGNLRANAQSIAAKMGQDEHSRFVGWAPLYHDQGLIGNVLQPLYLGAPAALMAPNTFLQRPHLWIEAVARYRAHTSGGPDYAFGLIADRIDPGRYRHLDLSCWKVAFNGAEPIRPHVLARFAQTLAPLGFSETALFPCYGLAEATLFSTGAGYGGGPVAGSFNRRALEEGALAADPDGVTLVSSGAAARDVDVVIVDSDTHAVCAEGKIGEVWLGGPSVALGYWKRPEATAAVFQAYTNTGEGPYLKTGDLGALVTGELYVCGRIKDLIIVRGRNIYPQDLEATARLAHPAVAQGSAAAAMINLDGTQQLLLAVEISRTARHDADPDSIMATLRRAIHDEHDVMINRLVLLLPGGVPKTTSGKVQRQALALAFEAGTLPVWTGKARIEAPQVQ